MKTSGFVNYEQPSEQKYVNHKKKLALKMQLEVGRITQEEYEKCLKELK